MIKLAGALLRQKVGVMAVIAFACIVFFNDGPEVQAGPANPWSKQAPVAQAKPANDGSITAKLGEVANQASEYAAEKILGDRDPNPVAMGEQTVGNFDDANSAFTNANNGQ